METLRVRNAYEMNTYLPIVALVALLAGCKTTPSPAELVEKYLSQPTCEGRLPLILNPGANAKAFKDHYKDQKTCVSEHPPLDKSACAGTDWKEECFVYTKLSNTDTSYRIVRTPDGLRIDWRSSVGYNPIPLKVFKSQMPKTSTIFRVGATISDYYNYSYSNKQSEFYSVEIRDNNNESLHAYLRKSAPASAALFDVLKDGREHAMMVELAYPTSGAESSVVNMTRMVARGWSEQPEELVAR
jgi:hypothetical protein